MNAVQRRTLAAFVEAQLDALEPGLDDPDVGVTDVLAYLDGLPRFVELGLGTMLDVIRFHSVITGFSRGFRPFEDLSIPERREVLFDLAEESLAAELNHGLISVIASVCWLVIHSRPAARALVGLEIPSADTVEVPRPPDPDLDEEFDVCVVGSGAGGAVVAARLAAEGRRVLVLEAGPWRSPHAIPDRDDHALSRLYAGSGIQPALSEFTDVFAPGQLSMMNVLQGRVVGGGPTVNNAIYLPLPESVHERWRREHRVDLPWTHLRDAMTRVAEDLGVGTDEVDRAAGWRSRMFLDGLGDEPGEPLPVAVRDCIGCGGCNTGCRFGRKTGGLHGPRPDGAPRSYLERALGAGAAVACEMEAVRFHVSSNGRVRSLEVRDRTGARRRIRARRHVLAAGAVASTRLLAESLPWHMRPRALGRGFSANIVSPVFAVMDEPGGAGRGWPDPGLQMCYYVDRDGHLLETWFHYPGSLSVALPGWFERHARVFRQYDRLATAGVVVPSGAHGEVDDCGRVCFRLTDDEFDRMLEGIAGLAEIFLEAGAERVLTSTRRTLKIRARHLGGIRERLRDRIRGPGDLNLATAHPQGGNALGPDGVVSDAFHVHGVPELHVADASLLPTGCEVNPQMTVMALAHLAADRVEESLATT